MNYVTGNVRYAVNIISVARYSIRLPQILIQAKKTMPIDKPHIYF